jgi:ABC-2 type transport system permease protein
MNSINLVRSEMRKLTTTRMPLAFVAVLIVLAVLNGVAVAVGTDMDGSKTFISTGADQQSLMAFAANALMITGLFGAISAAREYAHNTVIATYLAAPHRGQAVRAQLGAVGVGGAILGLLGAALTIIAVAISLPLTDHGFMVSASGIAQVLAAATLAGAVGAVLGAAIGTVVRNTGGAVTGAVLVLVIAPPLTVQMANGTSPWIPSTVANVISGVADETSGAGAGVAMILWALVPALIALQVIRRRDIV